MVPSVGQHHFIYRLLFSNHLPLEQKSTEVLWNFNFYYRVWKYPRQAQIEPPCLCVDVCLHMCFVVDMYFYRDELPTDAGFLFLHQLFWDLE